jgi:hypothetical protein
MGESSKDAESDLTPSAGDLIGRLSLSTHSVLYDMYSNTLFHLLRMAVSVQCNPGTGLENMQWDRNQVA